MNPPTSTPHSKSHLAPTSSFDPNTPLISPSKARKDAQLAQDWAAVDAWLASAYSPGPTPKFERNNDTLRALLALILANESADHERTLLHHARVEQLAHYESDARRRQNQERDTADPFQALLDETATFLDDSAELALFELAESHVLLGTPLTVYSRSSSSPNPNPLAQPTLSVSLATQLSWLTTQTVSARAQLSALTTQQRDLACSLEQAQSQLAAFAAAAPDPATTAALAAQAAQWTRELKVLALKVAEYEDRITALARMNAPVASTGSAAPPIEDALIKARALAEQQCIVEGLERDVTRYHGLPPDVEAVRAECVRARGELEDLKRRRDELFERLVE